MSILGSTTNSLCDLEQMPSRPVPQFPSLQNGGSVTSLSSSVDSLLFAECFESLTWKHDGRAVSIITTKAPSVGLSLVLPMASGGRAHPCCTWNWCKG